MVKDRVSMGSGGQSVHFHWARQLNHVEHAEVIVLLDLIASMSWAGVRDVWRNDVCDSGRYSVRILRTRIRELCEVQLDNSFIWLKWIPIKAN